MIKNEFYYKSSDGKTDIHAVEWLPEENPKAIIQVAHGVTEYILRYELFAKYLTNKGIAVVGNDHLGHGQSIAKDARPMYFGPVGSWDWAVEDLNTCRSLIKEKFHNTPYCLLGFSLGSFLVRTFLIKYPDAVDMAILMGTGQTPGFQIALAKFMANKETKKFGEENSTPMIKKLTFETYNKKFAPNRTEFDWLCSSKENLDKYIADPLRGGDLSAGLFREMLSGMTFTGKMKNIEKMNKNAPVLFISGDMDPVGEQGKGVIKAYNDFNKSGIKDVDIKLYKNLRHDILNEDCKEEIYNYIYNWINKKIKGSKMKTLKFRENLSKLILKGEKTATWRIFDDKDITKGDIMQFLVWETKEEFAKAKIIEVVEKRFSELDEKDLDGHEKFNSKEEMYATYTKYYNKEVDENTVVKIIKFELI